MGTILIAPPGVGPFSTMDGTIYTPDSTGLINVLPQHTLQALNAGFQFGVGIAGSKAQFGNQGIAPAYPLTNFAQFSHEGNVHRNVGLPIASNAADTTDDILDGFVLPAGVFDKTGRGLHLLFGGKFATNANNKKVRVWLNPTMAGQTITNGVISGGTVSSAGSGAMIYDSGVLTGSNIGWFLDLYLFKYGALGSNTQMVMARSLFGATPAVIAAAAETIPENAAINVVITGSSSTTGAAADVLLDLTEANALN